MLEETIQKITTAIEGVDIETALKALAQVDRTIRAANTSEGPLPDFKPMNSPAVGTGVA